MTDDDVKFLTSRMERNIATDGKASFREAIHVMLQWRLTVSVTVRYLRNLDALVSKWKMHYKTVTPTDTNHAPAEFSHQKLIYLDTRATVMLICNNFVEQCLMNGWVGCVKKMFNIHQPDHR